MKKFITVLSILAVIYFGLLAVMKYLRSENEIGYPDSLKIDKKLLDMISKTSGENCASCHKAQFEEHAKSMHARAWVNGIYKMSAGTPPRVECRSCHSMYPVLMESISGKLSDALDYRPLYRPFNQGDGVGCVTCHLRDDGKIAAKRTVENAPCLPVKDSRITSLVLCGTCHNPTHFAIEQFKQSESYAKGKTCVDCHTPHKFHGGFDSDFVKTSVESWTKIEDKMIKLYVKNLSAHKFPAEVPTREFRICYQRLDAEGIPIKFQIPYDNKIIEADEDYMVIKMPRKDTIGLPDNRLLPDETREIIFDIVDRQKTAVITMYFIPFPLMPRDKWVQLGAYKIDLEK
ncbi:MAG: hypothetical protein HY606_07855 [Planctomycetes bacterium]|nr:hypothetical protein [Planctomycetota bacterium]